MLGRYNVTDGVLTFGMTLALVSMRAFFRDERPVLSLALLGLGCALAVLAKGLIGIVLPGLVFLLYIGVMGEWRRLGRLFLSPAPFVLLAVAAPWFVLMERRNPGFSQVFFIREHFQRFATNEAKREAPFYFFVLAFIGGFLPYTIPFGVWLSKARPRWRTPDREWLRERADTVLFAIWFFVILVFFSVSKSKLLPYILPAFPAAAAITARFIVTAERRPRPLFIAYAVLMSAPFIAALVMMNGKFASYISASAIAGTAMLCAGSWAAAWLAGRAGRPALMAAALGWAGLYAGLVFALPGLSHELSMDDLARAAVAVPGARVVAYRTYPAGIGVDAQGPGGGRGLHRRARLRRRACARDLLVPRRLLAPVERRRAHGRRAQAPGDRRVDHRARSVRYGRVQHGVSCSDQRACRLPPPHAMSADKTLIRDTFLPFSRPSIGEAEIAELVESLQSGWITTGPKVEKFSAMFAEYVGRQTCGRVVVGHRGTASRVARARHRRG